jgi:NodT family efflux transporter outer membrane factor (OMF) lipoprotein
MAFAVLPWLAGCMPSLAPEPASPALPSAYSEKADDAAPLTAEWPKAFRSDELVRLIEQAGQDNLDLAGAVARINEAEAGAAAARAALFPTLDASASAQRSASPGTLLSDKGPFTTSVSNQFGAGLTASYAIDAWGRYGALHEADKASAEAARFDRDALQLAIAASTATTYFDLLATKDRIALQEENVRLASHILEAIKARVAVGTASALDIAEQESVVASQRAAIPSLEQQKAQSRNQLAILLGRPPEGFEVKGTGLAALTIPELGAGLPSRLLLRRPDVAKSEADLRAAEANVAAARAAYLPSFDLTLKGGQESRTLETMLRPDAAFASALGSLAAPIFDGGALDASYNQQNGRREELVAAYRKAALSAYADVENALVGVRQNRDQETLQRAVVEASKRAYAISEERLRAGTIDIVTLLTIQQNLFQAEAALIQSRLNRLQSAVALAQALGGGFEVKADAALRQRIPQPPAGPKP